MAHDHSHATGGGGNERALDGANPDDGFSGCRSAAAFLPAVSSNSRKPRLYSRCRFSTVKPDP